MPTPQAAIYRLQALALACCWGLVAAWSRRITDASGWALPAGRTGLLLLWGLRPCKVGSQGLVGPHDYCFGAALSWALGTGIEFKPRGVWKIMRVIYRLAIFVVCHFP